MTDSASATRYNPDLWYWGTADRNPRMLHTMIRVRDLDASLHFYIDVLGMKQLSDRFDVPARRVSAVFVGFDSFAAGGCLELVHSWDQTEPHTHGSGYGHISIGAPDIEGLSRSLEQIGVGFTLKPTALLEGGPKVAFIKDPDGYSIELLQTRRDAA